jgi:hypothetical protein
VVITERPTRARFGRFISPPLPRWVSSVVDAGQRASTVAEIIQPCDANLEPLLRQLERDLREWDSEQVCSGHGAVAHQSMITPVDGIASSSPKER